MSQPCVGEVRLVGFSFALVGFTFNPMGWQIAAGQFLSISQNTALFSLLGINYGGNGTSNFALPNLQGSVLLDTAKAPA